MKFTTNLITLLGSVLIVLGTVPMATAQEESPGTPAGGRVVFAPEGEVPQDVRDQFESNFEWGESEEAKAAREQAAAEAEEQARLEAEAAEQARLEAEAAEKARLEAEAAEKARMEAEAAEKARLEAELEQARMEAEQAKAEAEAARKQAEAEAKAAEEARKAEEEARKRAEAEAKAAEEARMQAEAEAQAAEAAREAVQAEEKAAEAAQAAETEEEAELEDAAPPAKTKTLSGAIAGVDVETAPTTGGDAGITIAVSGEARDANGVRLETAAYFFDAEGNALQDSDNEYRSSRGQVYVGEYRTADSNPYQWTESLVLPVSQLDLPQSGEYSVKVQVIVWEYSNRRGQVLAQSEMQDVNIKLGPTQDERRMSLAGMWSDGVAIAVTGDAILVEGLDVRGSIEGQQWTFANDTLSGVLNIRRRIGADRIGTYTLMLSEDGNTLSGAYTIEIEDGTEGKDEGVLTLPR